MMRSAGILMPLTSLPSPWGVGTLGAEARAFVDFLARAGQTYWQVLPIGPTSYGDSPYQAFSSFAGNPYLIDLDDLCAEGLLKPEEYQGLDWGEDPERVDYGLLYRQRFPVLRQAVRRLRARRLEELAAFCAREADWLDDYALFMALKGRHDGAPWSQWPAPLRRREPAALAAAARELDGELWFWKGVQFLFFRQWEALKARAAEQGVAIIGDLPIYVAEDSADVWADPSQFQMDEALRPTGVAGCPPDGFSADGQRWGNPLFDWEAMKADGYRWWLRRISFQFRFYDVLRIDHFRGFEAYYAIPAGAENAKKGFWKPGPGLDFFQTLEAAIGKRPIIAEDLGFLTPAVHQLLADTGFPGMKVLQFAFDSRDGGGRAYQPHNYPANCVAYVGTHDNDTALGWYDHAPEAERAFAERYLGASGREEVRKALLRCGMGSTAELFVAQMQDYLALGSEGRINVPGVAEGNWRWRMAPGAAAAALAAEIRTLTETYGR